MPDKNDPAGIDDLERVMSTLGAMPLDEQNKVILDLAYRRVYQFVGALRDLMVAVSQAYEYDDAPETVKDAMASAGLLLQGVVDAEKAANMMQYKREHRN